MGCCLHWFQKKDETQNPKPDSQIEFITELNKVSSNLTPVTNQKNIQFLNQEIQNKKTIQNSVINSKPSCNTIIANEDKIAMEQKQIIPSVFKPSSFQENIYLSHLNNPKLSEQITKKLQSNDQVLIQNNESNINLMEIKNNNQAQISEIQLKSLEEISNDRLQDQNKQPNQKFPKLTLENNSNNIADNDGRLGAPIQTIEIQDVVKIDIKQSKIVEVEEQNSSQEKNYEKSPQNIDLEQQIPESFLKGQNRINQQQLPIQNSVKVKINPSLPDSQNYQLQNQDAEQAYNNQNNIIQVDGRSSEKVFQKNNSVLDTPQETFQVQNKISNQQVESSDIYIIEADQKYNNSNYQIPQNDLALALNNSEKSLKMNQVIDELKFGLKNLSMTCYFNSAIQILANIIVKFKDVFDKEESFVTLQLVQLSQLIRSQDDNQIKKQTLYMNLFKKMKNDTSDMFQALAILINQVLSSSSDQLSVQDLLQHKRIFQYFCPSCKKIVNFHSQLETNGQEALLFEPFNFSASNDLSLEQIIYNNCIRYSKSQDNKLCFKCNGYLNQRFIFSKLPKVLFIKTWSLTENQKKLQCNILLKGSSFSDDNQLILQQSSYSLSGIVHLRNNGNIGHYWCTLKIGQAWYRISDDIVQLISEQDLNLQNQTNAYLCLYMIEQ